jgi:enoyl-CoA hydratase/carnithine racemase
VAADLSLSGRVVDADEARRTGLVSRIVDDPRTVADEVAAHPPDALAAIGRLLQGRDAARRSTIEREAAEAAAFASLLAEHGSRLRAERDDG